VLFKIFLRENYFFYDFLLVQRYDLCLLRSKRSAGYLISFSFFNKKAFIASLNFSKFFLDSSGSFYYLIDRILRFSFYPFLSLVSFKKRRLEKGQEEFSFFYYFRYFLLCLTFYF